MRQALLTALTLLAACQPAAERHHHYLAERKPPPQPHLAGTIDLPHNDGRVHIIKSPDPLGLDTSTCFALVSPRAGSVALACTGPRGELQVVDNEQ